MIHTHQLKNKGNGFLYAHSGGVSDATLLKITNDFRTQTSRKYKNLTPLELPKQFQENETLHASIKYDGEGVFVYFDKEKDLCVAFNSPSGRTRIGLPCLHQTRKALEEAQVKKALLAAECYLQNPPTNSPQRTRVADVLRATANGSPEERDRIGLAFYDLLMIDGKDYRENPYEDTWTTLGKLLPESPALAHRATGAILPAHQIPALFEKTTQKEHLEGLVLRPLRQKTIYKLKPQLSVDATVIGFVEGEYDGQYGVLSLLCALTAPDNQTLQTVCRVGSGLDNTTRESLLPTLQALKCQNPIPVTDAEGRPTHFVKPKIVVQIDGECLQSESLQGEPMQNPTFLWDATTEKYQFLGLRPSTHVSHATFSALRPDKTWNNGGTRMEQILDHKTIDALLQPTVTPTQTPKIIHREVFRKENRGAIAIRKIVVVERNQPGYHKYTLHFTDYSQGRAEPLKTETRVAETPQRLQALLEPLQNEGSKKGWTKL